MKKLALVLFGLSTMFLVSCTEDIVDAITDNILLSQLVGTWESSEITKSGCDDSSENGTDTCTSSTDVCISLTVRDDGTYTLVDNFDDPPLNETGTITVAASTFTLCPTGSTDCDDVNYFTTGTTLTVNFDDEADSPGCEFTIMLEK